jgi:hypothetical protein
MVRIFQVSVFIIFLLLAGCTNTLDYDDDDVAALVNGKEITIGELRFLYADDAVIESMDWAIMVELAKQEVKNMNLDPAGNMMEEAHQAQLMNLPPKSTENETEKSIREFAESQADKLGLNPEEYHQMYTEKINEQNAYMVAYLEEMLGEPKDDSAEEMRKYNKNADNLLDELVKENEEAIEIFIE